MSKEENIAAVKKAICKDAVLKDVIIDKISADSNIFPREHFLDIYSIRLEINKHHYEQAIAGVYNPFTDTKEKLEQTKALVLQLEKLVSDLMRDVADSVTLAGIITTQGEYLLFMTGTLDRIISFIHFDLKHWNNGKQDNI